MFHLMMNHYHYVLVTYLYHVIVQYFHSELMLEELELVEEVMVDVKQYYNLILKFFCIDKKKLIFLFNYIPFNIDAFAGNWVIPVTCCVVIVVVSIDELVRTVVTV